MGSKWVIKQQRQLATSTTHLAQERPTSTHCSDSSRSFAKEMRALKMSNVKANHRKVTTTSWKDHQSWSSYNYNRSCPRTQCRPLIVIQHLKQIGKVKKLNNWVPHELTTKQNNRHFVKCCLLLFYATTMNHFLIGWWCATKSGFYATTDNQRWPAQLLNWEETPKHFPKHFPKPNLHQK